MPRVQISNHTTKHFDLNYWVRASKAEDSPRHLKTITIPAGGSNVLELPDGDALHKIFEHQASHYGLREADGKPEGITFATLVDEPVPAPRAAEPKKQLAPPAQEAPKN